MEQVDAGWSQDEEDGVPLPGEEETVNKLMEEQTVSFSAFLGVINHHS